MHCEGKTGWLQKFLVDGRLFAKMLNSGKLPIPIFYSTCLRLSFTEIVARLLFGDDLPSFV
jgi:hypothetical protein